VLLAPLPGPHTADLARMSLAEMIARLRLSVRKSITWDGGNEMAQQHPPVRLDTGLQIHFYGPRSRWQRGRPSTQGSLHQPFENATHVSESTPGRTRPRKKFHPPSVDNPDFGV
jgi:IS30 family transposase